MVGYGTVCNLMLKTLRKNTKAIVWAVMLSFLLWGGYSVSTSFRKEGRAVGEVFGKEITFQEFDSFYRGTQIFSPSTQKETDPEILKEKTWQNILYSREAKNQGFKVTDDEVRHEVLRLLQAQGLKNLSSQQYNRWVQANFKESPRQFEEKVRDFMQIHKLLRAQLEKPVVPPSDEELKKAHEEFLAKAPKDAKEKAPDFETWKKKYIEHLSFQNFMSWTADLYQKAEIKDYMPRPEGSVAVKQPVAEEASLPNEKNGQ